MAEFPFGRFCWAVVWSGSVGGPDGKHPEFYLRPILPSHLAAWAVTSADATYIPDRPLKSANPVQPKRIPAVNVLLLSLPSEPLPERSPALRPRLCGDGCILSISMHDPCQLTKEAQKSGKLPFFIDAWAPSVPKQDNQSRGTFRYERHSPCRPGIRHPSPGMMNIPARGLAVGYDRRWS